MSAILFIAVVGFIVGMLACKNTRYKETAYYQITGNSCWFMSKGTRGEYLIYEALHHLEAYGCKFLFNIYLPTRNGETAEIDALLITSKGLFVFESKNYGGWIFGNETHTHWTQTFPQSRGRSHKERFYNPIKQNSSHIGHLMRFLEPNIPVWSIIVFSNRCTLKDITVYSGNVHVASLRDVASVVTGCGSQMREKALSDADISRIYNGLYPYTQVDYETKRRHMENSARYG